MRDPQPPNDDLAKALAWLSEFTDYEQKDADRLKSVTLELERMSTLCEALGHPEDRPGYVHVAGSKGKGSTVFFTEALLRATGHQTGRFLSPHLEMVTERIARNGRPVSDTTFRSLARRLEPWVAICRKEAPEFTPSFFECITAMAFLAFAEPEIDFRILEVGLGGRLDATNVVLPEVSLITTIDLEHTRILGTERAMIAREKGGIVKLGVPVALGFARDTEEGEALHAITRKLRAPAWWLGEEIRVENLRLAADSSRFDLTVSDRQLKDLKLASAGPRQAENAALAIAALRLLEAAYPRVWDEDSIRRTLGSLQLPARLEQIPPFGSRLAPITLDCAHTPASMATLAGLLRLQDPESRGDLLIGMLRDKDVKACLLPLSGRHRRVFVTEPASPRALDGKSLLSEVRRLLDPPEGSEWVAPPDLQAFLSRRLAEPRPLVVAGSVYLAGAVRRYLRQQRRDRKDPWNPDPGTV